jgi:HSP20 family molecular chaperone IbpA
VESNVNRLQAEGAALLPRVQQHTARLAAATWLRQALFTDGTALTQKSVTAAGNRLAYDTGMVSENLFRQLLTLDGVGIGMGPDVRSIRKALVLRIKQLQSQFDTLRKRVLALPTSYPRLPQLEQVLAERAALLASDTEMGEATDNTSTASMHCSSQTDSDSISEVESSEEDTEDEATMNEDQAEATAAPTTEGTEASASSFAAQFPAHLRFKPNFEEHSVASGGRLLVAALPGVREADCEVTLDQGQRTLTVRGIRRLHSSFGGFAGYRWFEEAFTIPAAFDLTRPLRSQFAGGQLRILLPRAPAAPKARPAPRYRYQQPQQPRGFSRHCSQPNLGLFGGYRAPQTARFYRPRRSPFARMGLGW